MNPSAKTVYEVGQLADILRGLLEGALPAVWVQGEVSNFRNPSGHWYFTLKDASAQIRCAMFKGKNFHVRPLPKDGDAVLLRGQVSFYTQRGDLQLIVEHLEPAGTGALLRAFEQLKAKLAAEGLFDEHLKRPLPPAPHAIGLITSATAAALQDILNTLARRYPLAPVYLYPVPVQGDTAPPAIVEALDKLPTLAPVDVMILARGGGSLEDLWCFNDERIARAIRATSVPVVTGIGHEIDFTIADFAADLRAPTPTAAAELVSPNLADWSAQLQAQAEDLAQLLQFRLEQHRDTLDQHAHRLQLLHPGRRLQDAAQRLDEWQERLARAAQAGLRQVRQRADHTQSRLLMQAPANAIRVQREQIAQRGERLQALLRNRLDQIGQQLHNRSSLLQSLNPKAVLERGYAIARRRDGHVIRDAAEVQVAEEMEVLLARGALDAVVKATRDS